MANDNLKIQAVVDLPNAKKVNEQIHALEKKTNKLKIDTALNDTGKSGKTLSQSLSEGVKQITSGLNGAAVITKIMTASRQAASTVRELDTVLLDLKSTSKMSSRELADFYYSANDTAKQMGTSTKEILTQAAAWSRLGFNTADAAAKMSRYSSMLAAISPGMSPDSAIRGLYSAMNAFKIGLENTDEVVDGIMSKINIISDTQTVNNSSIVDFLTRSSAAMAEADNTLDDTIALGAAMIEITGDAASAGEVLNAISMRIRGYDENANAFIGDIGELSDKIADLTRTASTPDGISLFSDKAMTQYKSTRQLLQEISEIYSQLAANDREELLGAIAGDRNSQAVSAVLSNYDAVTASLELMADSAGNAGAEMAAAMDSIDYKLNKVKETGTGIAQNLFEQDDIKSVLDVIASLGSALDWLTDKLGLFGTAGTGLALFLGRDKLKQQFCPLWM